MARIDNFCRSIAQFPRRRKRMFLLQTSVDYRSRFPVSPPIELFGA